MRFLRHSVLLLRTYLGVMACCWGSLSGWCLLRSPAAAALHANTTNKQLNTSSALPIHRSCTIFSLHFTYQFPHCYSQLTAPAVRWWHSIVHRCIPHRFCVFSHQAWILSHRSLPLAFTQWPLSESYKIGCCSVWYSAKAPRISTQIASSLGILMCL